MSPITTKEDSKVGCAVISDNHSNMHRIPDDSSIFTAEAKAIDLALDFISTCDANNKFLIFSDSLSVLKAMNHTSSKNPQIQKLLEKYHEFLAYKEIVLCWIPSHIGIKGNEIMIALAAIRSKAVVLLLLIRLLAVTLIVGFCNCSMFCCALLCVHSSFATISMFLCVCLPGVS